ncbi:NUDIX hydrolase [Desulfolithobacter dissulfuricans]|uniref:8-oxo-dGTP diphosphatase n=1 Tax=Desulfolithobacter dissulfuricans TaxID=2795293 RepID=A0A915XJ44_9BACT|nr:8-oxo-dGTP diphosphatase MutT [Desulfolithobacter dissulfuricans]BCO09895.1 NUDIX hydrolase [Desulfolithobacter dissulfuricans]
MTQARPKIIDVAAGVFAKDNQVLVARRAKGQHLAGKWEFPGGKIEHGETPEECLCREFKEEFDVTITVGEYVAESIHKYPDKNIRLLAYYVTLISGNFTLKVHDAIKWVEIKHLLQINLAEADIPIAAVLEQQENQPVQP